jgi:superfamily II DNA or RNA helicase
LGTLKELQAKFSEDPHVRGRQFERVCRWYLLNDPAYSLMLREVWLWDDWPGRTGRDAGIDLVAETTQGELWAIQAKCYAEKYPVKKADIDSFLSDSSRPDFAYRLIIATTDYVGPTALRTLAQQEKPAHTRLLAALEAADVDWPPSPDDLLPRRLPPKRPFPHNEAAVRAVLAGFEKTDRGQVIMACGTGKTLVALWAMERLQAERTLVLVPSLSLLSQTIREWSSNAARRFTPLTVCSDDTVGGEDHYISSTVDLGFPVTTSPNKIAAFLRRPGPSVVFSTYQSSPRIAEAFKSAPPAFDLVIADEAHRCAGASTGVFNTILDGSLIEARRRLFLTATPRYLSPRLKGLRDGDDLKLTSMDDPAFGPVFHRLTFGEAIKKKLLSDYQVVIVAVDEPTYARYVEQGYLVSPESGGPTTDARTLAAQIGLIKSISRFNLQRVLTFHGRVRAAKRFAESMHSTIALMPAEEQPSGTLWASHVSGAMASGERDRLLRRFGQAGGDERALLSNVRCLAEGVDVPSIDGLAFIDPRTSPVEIVQSVGRVLRRSAGKTKGTLVLPVFIDSDADQELALSSSAFAPIWVVLTALRAHDETLAEELDALRRSIGRGSAGRLRLPDRIKLDLPRSVGVEFARAFTLQLVERTTRAWEFWFGLLEAYVEEIGHSQPQTAARFRGHAIGVWVSTQRVVYANGERQPDGTLAYGSDKQLTPARVELLQALQGWTWSPNSDYFELGFEKLTSYAEARGSGNVSMREEFEGFALGRWVAWQRSAYKTGSLSDSRIKRLEAIPQWAWSPYADNWEQGLRVLLDYLKRGGNVDIGEKYREGDFPLGRWIQLQRQHRRNGKLPKLREARLQTVKGWRWDRLGETRTRPKPESKTRKRSDEAWQLAYERLLRYVEEHQNARPHTTSKVDGFGLGYWVNVQRKFYKKGFLEPKRQQLLEAVPGWTWVAQGEAWENAFNLLQEFVRSEGHAKVPPRGVIDGIHLGRWIENQRKYYRRGTLDPSRRERLETVPGWTWG